MLNIAICDDEKPFLGKLERIIAFYMQQKDIEHKIATFDNGNDIVKYCRDLEEDAIVFLDINMEDLDGIETAMMIRQFSRDIFIVFVTAYVKYSIEGYKPQPIRYILKGDKNFEQTMEECLDDILGYINYGVKKIIFSFKEGEKEIAVNNIIYIESNLHTVNFYVTGCKKRKYSMTATLNEIEGMLEECGFLRIHQSFLINIKHVKKIRTYVAEMDNGAELAIPRTKYRFVKEAYVEYMGEI